MDTVAKEILSMKSLRIVLLVALAAVPVLAHHGGAEYDSKTLVLTGTVKEFQFTNPHSWIQVDVKDQSGKTVEWNLEWGSPNTLTRQGIHQNAFPAGAKATFKVHPVKTGAPIASFMGAKFEDGTIVGKWDAEGSE
jgi:hypothetical protein